MIFVLILKIIQFELKIDRNLFKKCDVKHVPWFVRFIGAVNRANTIAWL